MRGKSYFSEHEEISDINITPFVDVLLVLLIVFMITAPLLTFDIPVRLPSSDSGKNESGQAVNVILSITKEHKIFLDSIPIKQSELTARLKKITGDNDTVIFIQADKKSAYGKVAELMALLSAAGFINLNLVIKNSNYAGD